MEGTHASVGAVDEDTIRRYIENQQWDDPGKNFKITAPTQALKPALSRAPAGGFSRKLAAFSRIPNLPAFSR